MMDATFPVVMLVAALALLLGYTPRMTAAAGLAVAATVAIVVVQFQSPANGSGFFVTLCCIGTIVLAAFVYWPNQLSPLTALIISGVAGLVGGFAVGAAVTPHRFYFILAAAALVIPASFAVERGFAVGPRVVASWLVAIALLAALLPYVIAHPGYVSEHRA